MREWQEQAQLIAFSSHRVQSNLSHRIRSRSQVFLIEQIKFDSSVSRSPCKSLLWMCIVYHQSILFLFFWRHAIFFNSAISLSSAREIGSKLSIPRRWPLYVICGTIWSNLSERLKKCPNSSLRESNFQDTGNQATRGKCEERRRGKQNSPFPMVQFERRPCLSQWP